MKPLVSSSSTIKRRIPPCLNSKEAKKACALSSYLADLLYEEGFAAAQKLNLQVPGEKLYLDFFPPGWFLITFPLNPPSLALLADPFGSFFQDGQPHLLVTVSLTLSQTKQVLKKELLFGEKIIIARKISLKKWEWQIFSLTSSPRQALLWLAQCQKKRIKFYSRLIESVSPYPSRKKIGKALLESLARAKNYLRL